MKSLKASVLAVCSLCFWSSLVFADVDLKKANAEPETQAYKLDGHDGVWLPLESAKKLRLIQRDYPLVLKKQTLMEELLDTKEKELSTLKLTHENEVSSFVLKSRQLEEAKESETQAKLAAESKLSSWYRNPYMWFCVGLVAGGGAVVAVTR